MKSCIDLTNRRIGKLTVISRASNVGRRVRWNCRCDCGKTKIIWAGNLLTKASKSCGCGWSKPLDKNPCWSGYGKLSGKQFWDAQHGAKSRNIPFKISIQYLWRLFCKQNEKCNLSGIELSLNHSKNGNSFGTASIDRIDNTRGYVRGNVQWVHKDINFMKQDLSQTEFINYCKLIAKTHES